MLKSYFLTLRMSPPCLTSSSGCFSSSYFFSANMLAPSSSSSSISSKSRMAAPPAAGFWLLSSTTSSPPSAKSSKSKVSACFFPSGLIVSTQPSSASLSSSLALSAWNFWRSAILFSHGTPLVTKNYLSGGRFLLVCWVEAPYHLKKHTFSQNTADSLTEKITITSTNYNLISITISHLFFV